MARARPTRRRRTRSPNAKASEEDAATPRRCREQEATKEQRSETHTDKHLFANPYAVLAEIAEETGLLQNISTRGDGGVQTSGPSTGAHGGEAYRDPFAPDFWSQQVSGGETAEGVKPSGTGLPANDNKPVPPNAEAPADAAPLEPLAKAEPKPEETARPRKNPNPWKASRARQPSRRPTRSAKSSPNPSARTTSSRKA